MIKVISIPYFLKFLSERKKGSSLTIYYDIETFSTNLAAEKPSFFKSFVWSLAISYYDDETLYVVLFHNFKEFLDCFKKSLSSGKVYLIAHNGNKYDHHFLRRALIDDYELVPYTAFSKNSVEHDYEVKRSKFQGRKHLLERRFKSKTYIELEFAINKKYKFYTIDSLPKTNLPLRVLGVKCLKAGLLSEDQIKTEMDYEKYNFEEELSSEKVEQVARQYFDNMNDKEKEYIINDVIVLAVACKNYHIIYPNFDFEKRTMSLNVLEQYTQDSKLALFQMLHKYSDDYKDKIDYINYKWTDTESLYTYFRKFYKGGLNFYNDRKIEKIINKRIFSVDLNSSYPNVMYNEKFPTFLKAIKNNYLYKHIDNDSSNFILLEVSKVTMNDLLDNIFSDVIRKMIVKYYSNVFSNSVYINNVTIDILNMFSKRKIRTINTINTIIFEAYYFGGRDKIFDYYKIKSQGKSNKLLVWKSPSEYRITNINNDHQLSQAEIDLSKLNLNTPYGIPALRKFFNVFKYKDGELTNFKNGHENSSRNLMFAVATTAYALRNLLQPLSSLTSSEIDMYFYYCDTDSLYLDNAVYDKVKEHTFFDKIALGAWDIEHDHIESFYIQNHKKYCFLEDKKITIKSGGIDVEAFDIFEKYPTEYAISEKKVKRDFTLSEFENFCKSSFSAGCKIYNNAAVLNNDETITIYKRETQLSKATKYIDEFGTFLERDVQNMVKSISDEINNNDSYSSDEGVFIETPYQNFGMEDIERAFIDEDCKELPDAKRLIARHMYIKELFYWDRIIN